MLKIIWSEFAESQLDNIYIYYKENADINVAKKLLKGIINEPNKLIKSQEIGQKEEFLMHREIEYRYLIYKNYKIIYNIDFINETIKISDVFDTRQNPLKLNRTK